MVSFTLVALWGVILPMLGFYRISRGGYVASNSLVGIKLPHDETTLMQANDPAGRAAQEKTDFVHRYLVALVAFIPALVLLPTPESGAPRLLLEVGSLVTILILATWSEVFEEHFELVGHGVEILVVDNEDYRHAEIIRMLHTDSTFRRWTYQEIDQGLRKREWLSRLFVKALRLS